jgi:hypothetical protein
MSEKLQEVLDDYLFHSNATPELQNFKVMISCIIVKVARHQLIDTLGDLDLDIEQESMRRSAMQFVDYRKEFEALSKLFIPDGCLEQRKKAEEEAKALKFKSKLFEGIANKVKEYQSNETPIAKIDSMDYERVSLDVIAKLPSQLKAALHESKPSGAMKAEDRDLIKELFKDELYESDQIEHMQLRRRFNDSLVHDDSINLADLDEERQKEEAEID